MNKKSIESDFLAARVKTAETIMNATGWRSGVLNSEKIGVDSVFFYAYDYQSKWLWCCSVPRFDFFELLKLKKNSNQDESVFLCEQMIKCCANENTLSANKQNNLAIFISVYTGITKSFKLTNNATKANHFGVIRYGMTNTLRPFALKGPARQLIDACSIIESFHKVIEMDSFNHPEMFANATINNFK